MWGLVWGLGSSHLLWGPGLGCMGLMGEVTGSHNRGRLRGGSEGLSKQDNHRYNPFSNPSYPNH